MTGEEMEKTIEFILHQQAKAEVEIQEIRETNKEIQEAIKKLTANGDRLQAEAEADRQAIREAFSDFRVDVDRLLDIVESDRKTFSKSISALSNAITEERKLIKELAGAVKEDRKLLREVTKVATTSEKRLTRLEERVEDIDNPQH